MWLIMMFGKKPFYVENGELILNPEPALPSYLVEENSIVEAIFLGATRVVYHIGEKKDYIPGAYQVTECTLEYSNGSMLHMGQARLNGKLARDVRDGMVKEMHITLH